MTDQITASFETLMHQGAMTTSVYLAEAISMIDEQLGEGFAEQHPILIGLLVLASAIDSTGLIMAQQTRAGFSEMASEQQHLLVAPEEFAGLTREKDESIGLSYSN